MSFVAVPGTQIGDFVVLSTIGRGGMANVYLAEHPGLGRKVALKIMLEEFADDPEFRERFAREAQIAAAIEHPSIVPVYDAGEIEGLLYIAMRYIEGTDLEALLSSEGPLSVQRTISIVVQLAEALDAAHARGLVHRDVKPSNVLVAREGSAGFERVYLADFGLARPQVGSQLTKAGQIYGTLDYMAPEQFDGRSLDARTDVYALACVAYECLAGEPPFRAESSLAKAAAHLEKAPVPVSHHNPDVSADVDDVVTRGLAKEKSQRFESAAGLATALADASRRHIDYDVCIAHDPRDAEAVASLTRRLQESGIRVAPDPRDRSASGEIVGASRAFAVAIGPNGSGDWSRDELRAGRDRSMTDRRFRLFPVLLPGAPEPLPADAVPSFLPMRTWVDLRDGFDDPRALQRMIDAITASPSGAPALTIEPDASPYVGLKSFQEKDSRFFFGRSADIQRLIESLKGSRFLAVLSPSGSGKSSLVRAGLIPALRHGAVQGSDGWTVAVMKPGAEPLTNLAASLSSVSERSMRATLDSLSSDERTLHLAGALALADIVDSDRLLLVVDQLEEVFTVCGSEDERAAFLSNIAYAGTVPGGRVSVVVTMRADFYARCAAYPPLSQVMAAHQFLVSPLTDHGLMEAIVEPARLVGLGIEEGLAETILDDVAKQTGALPLLQHALYEMWTRRRGQMLTLEAYRESGGVAAAIANRADATYESLDEGGRSIVRRTMLRLTQPGEGTEDTRRRVSLDELITRPEESEAVEDVVDELVKARLLTAGTDVTTGERTIDVAHEALIRAWPRLRAWLDEDRAGLLAHRRLTEAAYGWRRLERDEGTLLRGAALAEAFELQGQEGIELNELEREFVDASQELSQREVREREEREQRELEDARRVAAANKEAARLFRIVAAVLVVALVGAVIGTTTVIGQRDDLDQALQESDERGAIALSRSLAAQALDDLDADLDRALLLAAQAWEISPTVEAKSALLTSVQRSERVSKLFFDAEDGTTSELGVMDITDDGSVIATSVQGGIRLWDAASARPLVGPVGFHGDVEDLEFSPDGSRLAVAVANGRGQGLYIFDTRTMEQVAVSGDEPAFDLAYSPDGKVIACATWGGFSLRDPDSAETVTTLLAEPPSRARPAAILPDTEPLATTALAFSPDGSALATVGDAGQVIIWDMDSEPPSGRSLEPKMRGGVQDVDFSPNGHLLAAVGSDEATMWDTASSESLWGVTEGGYGFSSVSFNPSGDGAIIAGERGLLALTGNLRSDLSFYLAKVLSDARASSATYVDNGSVASSGQLGLRIWNTTEHLPLHRNLTELAGLVPGVALYEMEFSRSGEVLVGTTGGSVSVLSLADGVVENIASHYDGFAIDVSPDGRLLALGSGESVTIWDVASDSAVGAPLAIEERVNDVAFAPGGDSIAVASGKGSIGGVSVWDLSSGALVDDRRGEQGEMLVVEFNPDGSLLAAGGSRGMTLWDLASEWAPLISTRTFALAFSQSGDMLAAVGEGGLSVWDVESGRPVGERVEDLTDRTPVTSVAFDLEGSTLILVEGYTTISLRDLATGRMVGEVLDGSNDLESSYVDSVSLSPSSTELAISASGRLELWDLDPEAWVDRACSLAGRELTESEWNELIGVRSSYQPACP